MGKQGSSGQKKRVIEKAKRPTKNVGSSSIILEKSLSSTRGKKVDKRLMKKQMFQDKLSKLEGQTSQGSKGTSGAFSILSLSTALNEESNNASSSEKKSGSQVHDNRPVKRNKAKRAVFAKEMAQMSQVLAHKSFQANPLATIREHLNNTVGK
jgi:hypothetical protein